MEVGIIEGIAVVVGGGIIAGIVNTIFQSKANSIHSEYTRQTLDEHGKAIIRLDDKIDDGLKEAHHRINEIKG